MQRIYEALSQYSQLVFDLLDDMHFYSYNDIIVDDKVKEYFGFGVVCFYEKNDTLHSCYTRLQIDVSNLTEHNVVVVERNVETGTEVLLTSGSVYDLDNIFTFLFTLRRSSLYMVNELSRISYKYPDMVTFYDDGHDRLYNKSLTDCNYAISH